jgi:hypothetical protein
MKSAFVPMNSSSIQLNQRSSITLKKVLSIADASTGQTEFEGTTESISGTIEHTYFS